MNAINQGDALVSGGQVVWWQVAMNFVVPYCVSTWSAVKIERDCLQEDGPRPAA